MKWFRDNLSEHEEYSAIDRQTAAIGPGARGVTFLPHFTGTSAPTWRMKNRASILGLDLSHGRYEIARALMEGVAFEIRMILDEMAKRGFAPKTLKMLGGAVKSELWPQIAADIIGLPVVIPEFSDMACIGAAILAGVGAGVFAGPEDGYARFRRNETELDFNRGNHRIYNALYREYVRKFKQLNRIYR
jgi:xylulokinase